MVIWSGGWLAERSRRVFSLRGKKKEKDINWTQQCLHRARRDKRMSGASASPSLFATKAAVSLSATPSWLGRATILILYGGENKLAAALLSSSSSGGRTAGWLVSQESLFPQEQRWLSAARHWRSEVAVTTDFAILASSLFFFYLCLYLFIYLF